MIFGRSSLRLKLYVIDGVALIQLRLQRAVASRSTGLLAAGSFREGGVKFVGKLSHTSFLTLSHIPPVVFSASLVDSIFLKSFLRGVIFS